MSHRLKLFYEASLYFVISRLVFALENNIIVKITDITQSGKRFVDLLNHWDSEWYLGIIKNGYMLQAYTDGSQAGLANWAFFPLFPLFGKLIYFTGIPLEWSGIIVNQIAFLISIYIFYLLVRRHFFEDHAKFITLIYSVTPLNIYISSAYSDTIFLLFSLISFYLLERKKYLYSSIAAGFLSASRFFGIMFILSFLFAYIKDRRRVGVELFCYILLCCSGLFLFMLYLSYLVSDPLAFYHIQKAWGHNGVNWIHHPINSLIETFMSGQTFAKWFFILTFIWIPYLVYRRFYNYAIFSGITLLAPIVLGTLWSYTRYSLSLFPIYIALGLVTEKSIYLRYLCLIVVIILHFGFYILWLNGGNVAVT